jgi:hypothetical protein
MPRFDPAMPLVHPLPDPERVELRPGLVYASAGGRELAMDLYLPADRGPGSRLPAVLLVHGEARPEVLRGVRGWGQYTGWGRLLAGEGLAGVAVEHRALAEAGFEGVVAELGAALAAVRDPAGTPTATTPSTSSTTPTPPAPPSAGSWSSSATT